MGPPAITFTDPLTTSPRPWVEIVSSPRGSISVRTVRLPSAVTSTTDSAAMRLPPLSALVHESELARNEPDSQVHHLPRAYDDGLPSSAIRLRM